MRGRAKGDGGRLNKGWSGNNSLLTSVLIREEAGQRASHWAVEAGGTHSVPSS